MSSINATSDSPFTLRSRIENANWIHSPFFDSALLILVPLVTLPIIAAMYFRIPVLAIGGGVMLAFAHYFSTVSFFFWDDSREYHRVRWLAFYVGPVIIVGIYLLLLGFAVPYIIQFILFFWNTWHVARQNCGILAIYRSRAGVSDPSQKVFANRAIIAVSTFLAVWNIDTHPQVAALFKLVSDDLSLFVKIGTGLVALVLTGQLVLALLRRKESIGLPEGLFLMASLAFFWPYIFIKNSEVATFAMLLPHYVQYMTLVWLIHRRKFGAASEGAPVALLKVSAKLVFLIPLLLAVGGSVYLMKEFVESHGHAWTFESFYLLVAFLHFYLDGLIWSFRRPHVRQTILPYLLRRPTNASA